VIYNKEVQTSAIEPETPPISEEDIRQQIIRERERELEADRIAREKELEEESVQLEKEIEQEIRGWVRVFERHDCLLTRSLFFCQT
jgi:dynein intermediate chain, cytosolic